MDISFQRSVDRVIGTFICLLLSLFYGRQRTFSVNIEPEKILIILLSEMGSLILASPMFALLKRRYPKAEIHVLLFEKNREMLEIMEYIPSDQIHVIQDSSPLMFATSTVKALRSIRATGFDVAIDCELFARISSILSFISGAKMRVGFHPYTQEGLYRGTFINRPVLYNPYQHISEQFVTLAEAIQSSNTPTVKRKVFAPKPESPQITFSKSELNEALNSFSDDFRLIQGKQLVLVSPSGGALPIRAWPLEYFSLLSRQLISHGYAIGIVGLEDDRHYAGAVRDRCRTHACIDFTGRTTSIRELLALMQSASLLIANDGGTGHLAALTLTPSIVFFGPETPDLYRPLSKTTINNYTSLSCSPCLTAYNHRNSPCNGDNRCLKSIEPLQVLNQALFLLKSSERTDQEAPDYFKNLQGRNIKDS